MMFIFLLLSELDGLMSLVNLICGLVRFLVGCMCYFCVFAPSHLSILWYAIDLNYS